MDRHVMNHFMILEIYPWFMDDSWMETHDSWIKSTTPRMIIDTNYCEGPVFELAVKLDTPDSMNYLKNNTIKSSFWIDKLRKHPQKWWKHLKRAQIKRISWDLSSIETNKSNKPQFHENRKHRKFCLIPTFERIFQHSKSRWQSWMKINEASLRHGSSMFFHEQICNVLKKPWSWMNIHELAMMVNLGYNKLLGWKWFGITLQRTAGLDPSNAILFTPKVHWVWTWKAIVMQMKSGETIWIILFTKCVQDAALYSL